MKLRRPGVAMAEQGRRGQGRPGTEGRRGTPPPPIGGRERRTPCTGCQDIKRVYCGIPIYINSSSHRDTLKAEVRVSRVLST